MIMKILIMRDYRKMKIGDGYRKGSRGSHQLESEKSCYARPSGMSRSGFLECADEIDQIRGYT
jgi:hypothetical protein